MKQQGGFTIVELLVVLAIIMIVPVIVISSFPSAKLQFSLSDAAYRFSQDVRLAQQMAQSSLPYQDAFGHQNLTSGYGVSINADVLGNTHYIIYANTLAGRRYYSPLDPTVKVADLAGDSGIIIKETSLGAAASIDFDSSGRPVITPVNSQKKSDTIDVVFAIASHPATTKTVSINAAGLIQVK